MACALLVGSAVAVAGAVAFVGLVVPHLTGSEVPAAETRRDERWSVRVFPHDGMLEGDPGEAEAWIGNTPPRIGSVRIVPDPAWSASDLAVEVEGWSDDDGDQSATWVGPEAEVGSRPRHGRRSVVPAPIERGFEPVQRE